MGKIKGSEAREQLPEKVLQLYQAVICLIEEGADFGTLKVSDITGRAGIGKGTAYEYFDSKEAIISYALLFFMEETLKKIEQKMWEKTSFKERLEYALEVTDMNTEQGVCTLRFLNLLYTSSSIGLVLREILKEKEVEQAEESFPPLQIVKRIVEKGISDGELRNDLPVEYMTYSLITRYITYCAMQLKNRGKADDISRYIVDGILTEFRVR